MLLGHSTVASLPRVLIRDFVDDDVWGGEGFRRVDNSGIATFAVKCKERLRYTSVTIHLYDAKHNLPVQDRTMQMVSQILNRTPLHPIEPGIARL